MNLTVESDTLIVENESGAIRLSAEEAAKLILHARKVLNQLAQSSQGGPVRAIATLQAESIRAVVDAHHTSVLLLIRGEDGEDQAYGFSLDQAMLVRDDLSEMIDVVKRSSGERSFQ